MVATCQWQKLEKSHWVLQGIPIQMQHFDKMLSFLYKVTNNELKYISCVLIF